MRVLQLLPVLSLLFPVVALAAHMQRVPGGQQAQEIAKIEQLTVGIRHLQPRHAVKAIFDSDAAFNAVIRNQIKRNNPDTEIEIGQRELVLLGLLKKSQNLHRILYSGLGNQVIGLYDVDAKTLYVRNHGNAALGVDRHVLVHEYTHALQDQNYDLRKLMPDQTPLQYRNSDAVSAHHALTEGDAVNTETLYIQRTYSASELSALFKQESQPVPGPSLPKAIQREFYFPYTTGVNFVTALYRHGGMNAINRAYRRLPGSTYEIMYPSAYLKQWNPVSVSLHAVTGMVGWKQVDDDVFGAFGYNLLLRQFGRGGKADALTRQYRGDRYVFLENGAGNAMLFDSVWTTAKSAGSTRDALVAGLKARYRHAKVSKRALETVKETDGAVALQVRGTHLRFAYAPTTALATQLLTAPTS